jgi:hypothetical protein
MPTTARLKSSSDLSSILTDFQDWCEEQKIKVKEE